MPDTPSYRSLTVCELVDRMESYRAGEPWRDPRELPMTVGSWQQEPMKR